MLSHEVVPALAAPDVGLADAERGGTPGRITCACSGEPIHAAASRGPMFRLLESHDLGGKARVHLLRHILTGENCAVTIKTTDIGRKTSTEAWVVTQGGTWVKDIGRFAYYAGPVRTPAGPRGCVPTQADTPASTGRVAGSVALRTCRTQQRARADELLFRMSLNGFVSIQNARLKGEHLQHAQDVDRTLNWAHNGCSAPWVYPAVPFGNRYFMDACRRHDFGYRNFGSGLALDQSEDMRHRIDVQLLRDMRFICDNLGLVARVPCHEVATQYYAAVRTFGSSAYTKA